MAERHVCQTRWWTRSSRRLTQIRMIRSKNRSSRMLVKTPKWRRPSTRSWRATRKARKAPSGDDENAVVDAPPFDDFDKNQDAQLDADEVKDVMEMEAEKRTESNTAHMPTGEDETKLVADADTDGDGNPAEEVIEKVDKDGDGKVSQTEYKEEGDGGSDMGEELSEAAGFKEDSTDPDDQNRVDAPAEKAKLLSTNFRTAQRSEAAFLSKFKVVKPRQIFVGLQAGKRGFAKALHAAVRRHHAAHHHGHKRHHALRHPVMLNKRPHHIQ